MISVLGHLLHPREVMTLKVEIRVTGDRLRRGIRLTEISGELRPEAQTCRTKNNRTLEVPSGYLTLTSPKPIMKLRAWSQDPNS